MENSDQEAPLGTAGRTSRRGPRGDISRQGILGAADRLLHERGTIQGISLRTIAAEVGVATNTLYTYFPSLQAIWHDLGDERLGTLHPESLLEIDCAHCAFVELVERTEAMTKIPGTLSLLRAQPVLGPHSFRLSETIMSLAAGALIKPRDVHDLIVGWFYGSNVLADEGWAAGTDEIRVQQDLAAFPLIANRSEAQPRTQLDAILRGIGVECRGATHSEEESV